MIESGVLPMDKICTHQLSLAEFQEGLDLVSSGTESVKVSLIPERRCQVVHRPVELVSRSLSC